MLCTSFKTRKDALYTTNNLTHCNRVHVYALSHHQHVMKFGDVHETKTKHSVNYPYSYLILEQRGVEMGRNLTGYKIKKSRAYHSLGSLLPEEVDELPK